jgi:hypothetical protein
LPADASELYRHANEPTFLLLIIGGEGVLVHDDNRQLNEDEGKNNGQSPRKLNHNTAMTFHPSPTVAAARDGRCNVRAHKCKSEVVWT